MMKGRPPVPKIERHLVRENIAWEKRHTCCAKERGRHTPDYLHRCESVAIYGLRANETYTASLYTSVPHRSFEKSKLSREGSNYLVVLPTAIVRNMLIQAVSILTHRRTSREDTYNCPGSLGKKTNQCLSIALIQILPNLILPKPPMPLNSVEMPRSELSPMSSRGMAYSTGCRQRYHLITTKRGT